MKNIRLIIAAAIISFLFVLPASAQLPPPSEVMIDGRIYVLKDAPAATPPRAVYYKPVKQRLINWKSEEKKEQRYVIGVRPFQLFNYGLKASFEFELARPGNWLQFELSGYYTPWADKALSGDREWNTFLSSFEGFQKHEGVGLSVGYKNIFGDSGWYINPGLSFTYFGLHYYDSGFGSFEDEELSYIERREMMIDANFYKSSLFTNFGRHFIMGKKAYLDAFIGVGLSYTVRESSKPENTLDSD